MTALLEPTHAAEPFEVAAFDDVTLSEIALADLLDRCERMHRSNIQHDPLRCLVCFGVR